MEMPLRGSHPSRGAWIETSHVLGSFLFIHGRTPHGVRGLKPLVEGESSKARSRTPHGVRGLKHHRGDDVLNHGEVAPLTGCVD